MRSSYDPRYHIAYIRFREKSAEVETVRISEELPGCVCKVCSL